LPLLGVANKLDQTVFWGCVRGTEGDYFIAQGIDKRVAFEDKKIFFSQDCATWSQLPYVTADDVNQLATFNGPFVGIGSTEYAYAHPLPLKAPKQPKVQSSADSSASASDYDDSYQSDEDQSNVDDSDSIVYTYYSETQRLVALVKRIDSDAAIVPRGAYCLASDGSIGLNGSFSGVASQDSTSLDSYVHARTATLVQKRSLMENEKLDASLDFLDPLSMEPAQGCWSIKQNSSATPLVSVSSLLWPGMTAYHQVGTAVYGYAYFGNGVLNTDLGFQL